MALPESIEAPPPLPVGEVEESVAVPEGVPDGDVVLLPEPPIGCLGPLGPSGSICPPDSPPGTTVVAFPAAVWYSARVLPFGL